ncbi:hypothetical protein [Sphingomonas pokkalii]|uniref:DUF7847 domain-containing protein n=1 Tax=Sphingomonas pokkalii TaxID=2175090 RepID=A0A2U0SDZ2_9SPHN|nr:hypothetical protein [Sphingomonas pokkalii]PVX29602.1 hypothetical protein DD559_09940 [Sphingomonas pokkalii]
MAKMGAVWDRTAEFLGERAGLLVPLALVTLVAPAAISANLSAAAGQTGIVYSAALVLQLLLWLVSLWGTLVVTGLAVGAPGIRAAGVVARNRLVASLIVTLTLSILGGVLMIPIFLLLLFAGYDLTVLARMNGPAPIDPATGMRIAAYMILLGAVLIVLFVRMIVVNAVLLREGGLFGSIRRSWQLTRRHTFRILGVLILFVVVTGVCQLAAQSVFGSVFALLLGGARTGMSPALVLTTIVTAIVQAGFMVVFAAFQGTLYVALTGETGQPDLHAAA